MIGVIEQESEVRLGAEEKRIALNILLVIYMHDKRYLEALDDIEELLADPEMQDERGYLLLKRSEVRQALANLSINRKPEVLQLIFNFFHNPA